MKAFVYKATVTRVVDGDTIDCDLDLGFSTFLKKKRIRLSGINAPESRTRNLKEKALGLAAKERLKELCGEEVVLDSEGTGKFGRILGVLYTPDGENINQKLVDEGHARLYDGGKRKSW